MGEKIGICSIYTAYTIVKGFFRLKHVVDGRLVSSDQDMRGGIACVLVPHCYVVYILHNSRNKHREQTVRGTKVQVVRRLNQKSKMARLGSKFNQKCR
ncbi:MAG: hypothetical protein ACYSTG_01695 [Planctomycetota bacterium]|jgi:hypothetical protein